MQENTQHTTPEEVPTLLKAISYFIIIKAGIKAITAAIILIGGDSVKAITDTKGFDTVKNGGPVLQLILITLGGLTVWGGLQLLSLKKAGLYVCIVAVVLSFFIPSFFSPTYQPTMTAFTLSAVPVLLFLRYWGRLG